MFARNRAPYGTGAQIDSTQLILILTRGSWRIYEAGQCGEEHAVGGGVEASKGHLRAPYIRTLVFAENWWRVSSGVSTP